MNNWFIVKVKYTKQLENGAFKRVTEPYLLAAMTFTDAEARIYEELGPLIRGEFTVTDISRTDFHDIFHYEDSDTWYKCKITFEGATEDSDHPKKITHHLLVTAHSTKEAFDRIHESLSTMLIDFLIPSIIESPIVDVFPYNEELDKEISRRPLTEEESKNLTESGVLKENKTYSAPGADLDDEPDELDEEDFDHENEED